MCAFPLNNELDELATGEIISPVVRMNERVQGCHLQRDDDLISHEILRLQTPLDTPQMGCQYGVAPPQSALEAKSPKDRPNNRQKSHLAIVWARGDRERIPDGNTERATKSI